MKIPKLKDLRIDEEGTKKIRAAMAKVKMHHDPVKRIGIIFRGIRFKNDLTQAEVAKRLGIDQSDVSKIEKGKRFIGKALAKKIEKEFGIDYRRFL